MNYRNNNNNMNFKPITQSTSPKPSNPHSIIYSNISQMPFLNKSTCPPQHFINQNNESQFESQSTIRSMNESGMINSPNYAVYSSQKNKQIDSEQNNEKMLICKSELVSFAQCFAQQKIQLQNTVTQLRQKVSQLQNEVNRLQQQNTTLKSTFRPYNHQPQQQPSPSKYQQQLQQMKMKIKKQFEKRMMAEKQYHNEKSVSFELNKKIEFLTQKLVYEQEQLNRCQNLLKIKQDIIQNFQWQKTLIINTTTARNNNNNNNNNNNINLNQSVNNNSKHNSSFNKININRSKQKLNKSNENNNSGQIKKLSISQQFNQTLNLSQINFNHNQCGGQIKNNNRKDGKNNNNNSGEKVILSSSIKKITKYTINKKPQLQTNNNHQNHTSLNDSKKKLNVSLKKKSLNSLQFGKNNIKQLSKSIERQRQSQKYIKLKNITIKKHISNQQKQQQTQMIINNDNNSLQRINNNSNLSQQQQHEQIQAYYIKIITQLEKQNNLLKNQLIQINKNTIFPSNNKNDSKYYTSEQYLQLQRKYNMLKQKCVLIENQLQSTIQKYLLLQSNNSKLQQIVKSLQNQLDLHQQYRNNSLHRQQYQNEEQQPLSRPSLGLTDLVTPQFRQSKWNHNFFPKNKQDTYNHPQKLFQNISLHDEKHDENHKKPFLDTFQKLNPQQQSYLIAQNSHKVSNSLFHIDQKTPSNVFKGSTIEDVSEIICRNDQQQVLDQMF